MGEGCSIIRRCPEWNNGTGSKLCYQCQDLNKLAVNHHHAEQFYTDNELVDRTKDDVQITSLFDVLRHIDPNKRILFEDHYISGVSLQDIADEHGMTKQQAYRAIRSVRHDIKKMMNLSTVF